MVATAVLFSSAFPGMFNTFIRWQFQRTYDALLATPIDVEELITAETLWVSIRAGVYGVAPLIVGFFWGLTPEPGMLLVPLIGFVTGFGFCSFGVLVAAVAKTIDNFNYVTSAVLTPMFLVAGTFFPISRCPPGCGRSRCSTRSTTASRSSATCRWSTSPWRRHRPRRGAAGVGAAAVAAGRLAPGEATDRLTCRLTLRDLAVMSGPMHSVWESTCLPASTRMIEMPR